ncbi:MAG: ribosome maturation factor RimM [Clostridiales bacterium]|nr:ribosome maturation factor RimM [Clostridiales bacterium]
METVLIGKIVNAVGLKGEVKLYSYSGQEGRLGELGHVFVEGARHEIEKARWAKGNVAVLKLSGIDDRAAAEGAKGKNVFINESDLPALPEGTYYVRDMIGLPVFDDAGGAIGELCDVVQSGAHDLYEVEMKDGKKILIPAVEEFVLSVDIAKKRIDVKIIEGLV